MSNLNHAAVAAMEGTMSHLLETLLADQRRIEADPAYIAPVVADEDRGASARFVSLAGQDTRVARLMLERAELCSALSLAEDAAVAHAARIRQLEHEVKLLRGQIDPSGPLDDDEFTFDVQVGTATNHATVWISAINRKSDNWTFGGVSAKAACINGVWVDIADIAEHLDPGALDNTAEKLVARRDEA